MRGRVIRFSIVSGVFGEIVCVCFSIYLDGSLKATVFGR